MSNYQIVGRDAQGQQAFTVSQPRSFKIAMAVNEPGYFVLDVAGKNIISQIAPDNLVEFYRATPGAGMRLIYTGIARRFTERVGANGKYSARIAGYGLNDLLSTRIVAYAAGTAQAAKSGAWDDIMKAIVRENLGTGAATARQLTSWLRVEADTTQGATGSKSFAWRNVLTVLRGLSDLSAETGDRVYYEVSRIGEDDFVFRTAVRQLGADRSFGATGGAVAPMVMSLEAGNLVDVTLERDYTEEATYIYAGGQGSEDDRLIVEVEDTTRSARSPWARREAFRDARNASSSGTVQAEAYERLHDGRPRLRFVAKVVETPRARYGTAWQLGDRVTALFNGRTYTGMIQAVEIAVREDGSEEIVGRLEVDDVL